MIHLSNALDSLAQKKEELGRAIVNKDFPSTRKAADSLEERVTAVKAGIGEIMQTVPPELRISSGKLSEGLQLGLTTKWQSLKDITDELDRKKLLGAKAETDSIVRLTYGLKAQVDSLISALNKS